MSSTVEAMIDKTSIAFNLCSNAQFLWSAIKWKPWNNST